MNVWIRGRAASCTASHARSMSAAAVRASAQITGPVDVARDPPDGLEVAGRGDREPGLDHVDAQPRELLRDLELLLGVEARSPATARRRAASCRRSVLGWGPRACPCRSCSLSRTWLLLGLVCGYVRPPARYSPRRGRRSSRSSRQSAISRRVASCRVPRASTPRNETGHTPAYSASISAAYFSAIGLRLSFIVGVSSSPAGGQSHGRTLKRLICSTRLRWEFARSTPACDLVQHGRLAGHRLGRGVA